MKKLLALLLTAAMILSLAACGEQPTPGSSDDTTPAVSTEGTTEADTTEAPSVTPTEDPDADKLAVDVWSYDTAQYYEDSEKIYNDILGDYYKYYQEALEVTDDMALRYALEAIAEAKLLNSAIMLPTTTNGGNYALSRVVPRTINSTQWGNDSDRFHNALVVDGDFMIPADRDEIKVKWAELAGTGEFAEWVEKYLADKGYTIKDTYTLGYNADPKTWDALMTYRTADSEAIVNTVDGLMEYDIENVQQPALAESYTINDDQTVFTFKLREGVHWSDSQGRDLGELTADDFVAGMQHLLDAQGGLEGLAGADGVRIVNADAYINGEVTDFAEVGVKALDKYTVEYTLEDTCVWFMTLLGYNPFFPICKSYYEAQGGKFGADFNAEDENYLYGKDPDHIAYCGPYLVTNATEANTIVFEANPLYWNKDGIKLKKITWLFNDGSDNLKAYNDAKAGTIDGCGLNAASVEAAKKDGLFDQYAYVSETDATSFMGFFNVMRNQFANVNDASVGVSTKTVAQAKTYNAFMQNIHFRHALATSIDRATYNAQIVGEELKLTSLRNSYVPATFVTLPEDVTVQINGVDTTFKAGTKYGEIVQAQLDADGFEVKVYDQTMDSGLGSGDGFDGWYNPEYAYAEFEKAVEELKAEGYEVSPENPIVIDIPYMGNSQNYTNKANVTKQFIEATLKNNVKVNLVDCIDAQGWYNAGYYPDFGYEMNADFMDVSGWGPDYGDPQSFLATMTPTPGGMVKSCGIY